MPDLETYLAQVWSPDVRPVVEEAWRCYNAGATRASIAATWTAVTADIITKLIRLADEGDSQAAPFREKVIAARTHGITPAGVQAMQRIEDSLLTEARAFELIDSIGERELERIRQDRNLCVHPSLREQGDVYEPRAEVARSHLAVALTTLLTHPPTQGRKILDEFGAYVCDPYFVPATAHIQAAFFDRVRSATRRNIATVAVKHALFELPPPADVAVSAEQLADRMATAVEAFAARDRELIRQVMADVGIRFQRLDGGTQLRALTRLGTQDFFWDMVDQPLAAKLNELVNELEEAEGWLLPESAATLALVRDSRARERMPALAQRYSKAHTADRMSIASRHPALYFVRVVIECLETAGSWRMGEHAGQLLVQHASYLSASDLSTVLGKWADNHECRTAVQMPDRAVELLQATAHLGPARVKAFEDFISAVHAKEEPHSAYRYPELEAAIKQMADFRDGTENS